MEENAEKEKDCAPTEVAKGTTVTEKGESSHGSWNFDLLIHYGGRFETINGISWYDGSYKVHKFANVDGFSFKYKDLERYVVHELGQKDIWMFYYRLPNFELHEGMVGCQTELDVTEMFDSCYGHKVIELYAVHEEINSGAINEELEAILGGGQHNTVEDIYELPPGVVVKSFTHELIDLNVQPTHLETENTKDSHVNGPNTSEHPNGNNQSPRAGDDEDERYDSDASSECEATAFADKGDLSDATDDEIEEAKQKRLNAKKGKKTVEETVPPLVNDGNHIVESSDSEDVPDFMQEKKDSSDPDTGPDTEEEDECFEGEDRNVGEENFKFKRFKRPSDVRLIEFELGMLFATAQEFRDAITEYSLAQRKDIRPVRNEKKAISFVCWSSTICGWRIWCSYKKDKNVYQITKFKKKHKCGKNFKNKRINSTWIAKHYYNRFKAHPTWKIREIKDEIYNNFEINVGLSTCKKARKKALTQLLGSMTAHYAKLWDYKEELENRNEGSTVTLGFVRPNPYAKPIFRRFYTCFDALRNGFLAGCKPCIGLDGCFLKGVQKGQLLTCVGRDANDQMYPICWAVVQVENKDNWSWFLKHIIDDLDVRQNGNGWTLITDQQKGLVPAIHELLPNAEHRKCARHIYSNWHKNFKGGQLRQLFWAIAKSSNEDEMEKIFDKLKAVDEPAYLDLKQQHPQYWCRAFFKTHSKVTNVDNNLSEAWNWSIIGSRSKPIIYMLEEIRIQLMERIHERRDWMIKSKYEICPRILKKCEKIKEHVKHWSVKHNGGQLFEVTYIKEGYIVDTRIHTCSCRMWELSGIPCVHAMAAIYCLGEDPEKYLSRYYNRESFLRTYSYLLKPIQGENQWAKSDKEPLLPPPVTRMPGRPKKNRRREVDENMMKKSKSDLPRVGVKISCKLCGGVGHNRRTCPEREIDPNAEKVPPKPRRKKTLIAPSDEAQPAAATDVQEAPTETQVKKKRVYCKKRNKGKKKQKMDSEDGTHVPQSSGIGPVSQSNQDTQPSQAFTQPLTMVQRGTRNVFLSPKKKLATTSSQPLELPSTRGRKKVFLSPSKKK